MRDYEEKSYYEIQLDNKQLILVFLAAVTVCVLIFVLGVMIGKGQKEAEMAAAARIEKNQAAPEPDKKLPSQVVSDEDSEQKTETQTPKQPVTEKEVKENESSSKPEQNFAYEDLNKSEPDTDKDPVDEKPVATEPGETEEVPKPGPNATQYTVQVMATSSRSKAEEQMSSLKAKGYRPFMDETTSGDINVFKVRVGRYTDTQQAKEMAVRIKKDLKLETWVAVLD